MSNLIEVLPGSSSHATPGWTYVPTGGGGGVGTGDRNASSKARKRAAREIAAPSRGDVSSKQHAATSRYLAELDRENHKDVHVPIPTKRKESAVSKGPRSKTTSNVRRILTSQKTFKNYLDDEEAALAQSTTPATGPRPSLPKAVKSTAASSPKSSGPSTPRPRVADSKAITTPSASASASTPATAATTTTAPTQPQTPASQPPPPSQLIASEGDHDPLLRSYIPKPPSDRIMQQLLAEPPLSYNASRAKLPEMDSGPGVRKPRRHFCSICGYWGRIKCIKCGARVCRLDCYRTHEETRCLKFYA